MMWNGSKAIDLYRNIPQKLMSYILSLVGLRVPLSLRPIDMCYRPV